MKYGSGAVILSGDGCLLQCLNNEARPMVDDSGSHLESARANTCQAYCSHKGSNRIHAHGRAGLMEIGGDAREPKVPSESLLQLMIFTCNSARTC